MTAAPRTWGELRELAHSAMRAGDNDRAEPYVARMLREAERTQSATELASAHFSLGMLRHAQGSLDAAHDAFATALRHDRDAHGPIHEALGDTWRSIGLVLRDMGPDTADDAVAAFERAAAIYARARPALAADAYVCAGGALLRAGRYAEARAPYRRAVASAARWSSAAALQEALLSLGEALRCNKETLAAYSTLSRATRVEIDGDAADMRSRVWYTLGLLAPCFQGGEVEARLAWLFARDLARDPAVRERARERARALSHVLVQDTGGAPAWRVGRIVRGDPKGEICHLLHPERGHWVVRCTAPAPLGEVVPREVDVASLLARGPLHETPDPFVAGVDLTDLDGPLDEALPPPPRVRRRRVHFVLKRYPPGADVARSWRDPPTGPPIDVARAVAEITLHLTAPAVTTLPDGGRRIESDDAPPIVVYATHAVVDLTEVEPDEDEDVVDAASGFLGLVADATGWSGSRDGEEIDVEPEVEDEATEGEERGAEPRTPPPEAWARAVVDALVAQGLIELTTSRARPSVEGRIAALLEDGNEAFADALVELPGVAEVFCDDSTLESVVQKARAAALG